MIAMMPFPLLARAYYRDRKQLSLKKHRITQIPSREIPLKRRLLWRLSGSMRPMPRFRPESEPPAIKLLPGNGTENMEPQHGKTGHGRPSGIIPYLWA
jgi:hypothetical protein